MRWRRIKYKCVVDSSILRLGILQSQGQLRKLFGSGNFLMGLNVVPFMPKLLHYIVRYSGAVANSKEPRAHKMGKHIECKFHLIREIIKRDENIVTKIASEDDLENPFTKSLLSKFF